MRCVVRVVCKRTAYAARALVLPEGFEPPITVPKTVVISISLRERVRVSYPIPRDTEIISVLRWIEALVVGYKEKTEEIPRFFLFCAGTENRTPISTLARWRSTIKPCPHMILVARFRSYHLLKPVTGRRNAHVALDYTARVHHGNASPYYFSSPFFGGSTITALFTFGGVGVVR